MRKLLKNINFRDLGVLYALIFVWVLLLLFVPAFRRISMLQSILQGASFIGICGIGMTLCIASKHFDQSVGAMAAFLGCTFGVLIRTFSQRPPQDIVGVTVRPDGIEYLGITWQGILAAFVITILLGIICGLINGALVAKMRIPAFIATLGTLNVLRGLAYLVTDKTPFAINQQITKEQNALFSYLGSGKILGISVSFWVLVVCAIAGQIIFKKMKLGRDTLAIGNSVEASRISGINIDLTKILVFTLLGFFTSVAAIMNTNYLGSVNPGMLIGFEFDVITVVVLGGTALAGGKGSIFNSIIAAIFLVTIKTSLPFIPIISVHSHGMITGALLLFAFSMEQIRALMEDSRIKARARKEAELKAL